MSALSSLAQDLAHSLSPVALAPIIGLDPDPWQFSFLEGEEPQVLLNCHRQAGKSTSASLVACHRAVYRAGSLILLLSPTIRQAGELLIKIKQVYFALRGRNDIEASAESENMLSLRLSNGSRIISLPGKEETVRGFSGVDLILADEASRIPDSLIVAVRPMLAVSRGRFIGMSTPAGKRGWFWDAWENGGPMWQRIRVPACEINDGKIRSLNPRIDSAFLEEERKALGDRWFSQEFMCEFVETNDAAFTIQAVKQAFDRDVEAIDFNGPVS